MSEYSSSHAHHARNFSTQFQIYCERGIEPHTADHAGVDEIAHGIALPQRETPRLCEIVRPSGHNSDTKARSGPTRHYIEFWLSAAMSRRR
jgi:hypothetical protein